MARRNLNGSWGESRRITLRLRSSDLRALQDLAEARGTDPSETIRIVIRDAAAELWRQQRQTILANIPTMARSELLALPQAHRVNGRSKMTVAELREAIHQLLAR